MLLADQSLGLWTQQLNEHARQGRGEGGETVNLLFPCLRGLCSLPYEWGSCSEQSHILFWVFLGPHYFGDWVILCLSLLALWIHKRKWIPFCFLTQCNKTTSIHCPNAALQLTIGWEDLIKAACRSMAMKWGEVYVGGPTCFQGQVVFSKPTLWRSPILMALKHFLRLIKLLHWSLLIVGSLKLHSRVKPRWDRGEGECDWHNSP